MAALFGTDGAPASGPVEPDGFVEVVPARASAAHPDPAALHQRHFLHLTRLAAMLVGDRETAEDVVQDVFAGMQRRWPRLSDPARAEAYLRAAVINGARTVLRRRRTATRHRPESPRTEQPAEDIALDRLRDGSVRAAVARLPRRQQEIILLRYLEDLSIVQTARVLGISQGAVKSSAGRALASLAALLGAEHDN